MDKFKEIDKEGSTEADEYQDVYDDVDLSGTKQVKQNIQDVVDEWWSNDNLTEEQQICKKELFPNGKPSADEFLIELVEDTKKDPEFQKMQEEIEMKARKREIIKDVLLLAFILLVILVVSIHISIMEKNDAMKDPQTETATSMKDYWW